MTVFIKLESGRATTNKFKQHFFFLFSVILPTMTLTLVRQCAMDILKDLHRERHITVKTKQNKTTVF